MSNVFPPGSSFSPPPLPSNRQPPVVMWFKVYAGFMVLLYIGAAVFGVVLTMLAADGKLQDSNGESPPAFVFGLIPCASLPMAVAFGLCLFWPRKKWAWVYCLVAICIGLTSPCLMPATIPLIIFWLKPETKAWYGA